MFTFSDENLIFVKLNTPKLGSCTVVSNMLLYGCTLAQGLEPNSKAGYSCAPLQSQRLFSNFSFNVSRICFFKSDHLEAVLN